MSLSLLTIGSIVWFAVGSMGCSEDSDPAHFQRRATSLAVSAPDGIRLTLLASGDDLDAVRQVEELSESNRWLDPGRWVVRAVKDGRVWYYPVVVASYRGGPDRDGRFVVSARKPHVTDDPLIPGMSFVAIPSGWFLFGDRRSPKESHYVWLTTYFLAEHEVTNRAFREFLTAVNGWVDDSNWTPDGLVWRQSRTSRSSSSLVPQHPDYVRFGADNDPITNVTWFEAAAYARWVTRTYGRGTWDFSLPHEAEWEKAARGPDDLEYSLSQTVSDREAGWYNWRKNPGAEVTVISGDESRLHYRPNRYGLYHMAGNVTEWTRSIAIPFGRSRPFRDDRRNDVGGTDQRVARGGSWYSASTALLNVSYREVFPPEHSTHELGFRLRAIMLPSPQP